MFKIDGLNYKYPTDSWLVGSRGNGQGNGMSITSLFKNNGYGYGYYNGFSCSIKELLKEFKCLENMD